MLVKWHEKLRTIQLAFTMLRKVIYAVLESKLNRAYRDRLVSAGASPKGVFWRNQSTQIARFDALLDLVTTVAPVANPIIADIGCGYGAMLEFIQKTPRYQHFRYVGVDINPAMTSSCKKLFPTQKQVFYVGRHPPSQVDFCVFSGTFNLCHTTDASLWNDYIFVNLESCWKRCRYGLMLNLLCASRTQINNQIFYAERENFITNASKMFGPTQSRLTPHITGDVTFWVSKP